ncbi:MAG: hypothetical protein OEU86_05265 [Gammaproteobacteria bacterium]|jgi:hypothetical protein|nr:hypothetical protein [Gammaproteobacteria bacterium]
MPFLNRVCSALAAKDIPYAIVGGHAVALHGAVRGTVDIDIVLSWNLDTLLSTEQALNQLGLFSRLPVNATDIYQFRDEYINNRNLIGWNFYNPDNPVEQVDIIITYDLKTRKIDRIETTAGPIKLLNKQDLIAMKKKSGRPQDIADIDALKKL